MKSHSFVAIIQILTFIIFGLLLNPSSNFVMAMFYLFLSSCFNIWYAETYSKYKLENKK